MSQLQLYIENLGEIKQAELTINPLTVLAGENGTGKSFVTKFLYSVLNVLGKNSVNNYLISILNIFKKDIGENLSSYLNTIYSTSIARFNNLDKISLDLEKKGNYQSILDFNDLFNVLFSHFDLFRNNHMSESDKVITDLFEYNIKNIKDKYDDFILLYENDENKIIRSLSQEIKDNFQISNIKELIHFGEEKTIFEIKGIIKIEIDKKQGLTTELYTQQSFELNRGMAFFESSVYWKLAPHLMKNANEEFLGIPKHFLDLKELLSKRFKDDDERPEFIVEIADELEKTLQGQFEFIADDIIYRKNSGQKLSKNLISFGITNLGIIQLLLSKNIVNRGSFIFIDEPESNLHPAWQAVLANILVKLAKHGVYIIMTTHSSDVLKALDVISQEHQQNEDFISVHYFERTGHLLALNQSEHSHIQQARLKLLETYDDLVLRGYLV